MRTRRSAASTTVTAIGIFTVGLIAGLAVIGGLYEFSSSARTGASTSSVSSTASSVTLPTSSTTPSSSSTTTSTTTTSTSTTPSTSTTTSTSTSSTTNAGGIFLAQFTPAVPIFNSGYNFSYSLAVQLLGGTSSSNLMLSVTGPTGITFNVKPAQITVTGGAAQTSVMVGAKPSTSLAAGNYPVTITASGGGASYTQSLNIQIVKYLVIVDGGDFSPASYTVPVGATVTWLRVNGIITENDDGTNNIHFTTANIPASPGLAQLESYSYTFTTAGTYPYKTDYRPTDNGTIIVTP